MIPKYLFIDDDEHILDLLREAFVDDNVELFSATESQSGLNIVRQERPNVAIIDIRLPGKSGLEILKEIKAIEPSMVVIMTTGYNTTQNAIEAMKFGAYDFLLKPFDVVKLRNIVEKGLETNLLSRNVRYSDASRDVIAELKDEEDIMIGASPKMVEVWKRIGQVASSDTTVLIEGESGTGKELLARAIYNNSDRKNKPFLAVNCAAIPESLLESELFGHERGSFTDAHSRRIGKFEQCHGGTLFLDEISEMSYASQGKLLRVIEYKEFERVGGNDPIHVDTRIIAATNRDLQAEAKAKKFRLDLFYRLNVVSVLLPPLRERQDDIPLLCDLFVRQNAAKYHKKTQGISNEALDILKNNWWEGNIRELKNTISSAVVFAKGELLQPEDFGPLFAPDQLELNEVKDLHDELKKLVQKPFSSMAQHGSDNLLEHFSEELERVLIDLALSHNRGNQVKTAKLLGISRNKLRNRIDKFQLG